MSLGPPDTSFWHWWVAGALMLLLEVMLPSSWLIGPAIAAILTGGAVLAGLDGWQEEAAMFAVLAVAATILWQRRFRRRRHDAAGHLNRRASSLIGRTGQVVERVGVHEGRISLDGTLWRAETAAGPLEPGTPVEIINANGMVLEVRPASGS